MKAYQSTFHAGNREIHIMDKICDPLWQKQAEVADDKTEEIVEIPFRCKIFHFLVYMHIIKLCGKCIV